MAHQEPAGRAQGLVLCEAHGDGWAVGSSRWRPGFPPELPQLRGEAS